MEPSRKVFVSYAREDREIVGRISKALRLLHCDPWIDDALSGGQAWWDVILEQIRRCDAVFAAISPRWLKSVACREEIDYAQQIGRMIVPMLVAETELRALPAVLAEIQIVDITRADFESGIHLASTILGIRPGAPVDSLTLPEPPPAPVSYLSRLSERSRSRKMLTLDDQLAIVARLEDGFESEADRSGIEQIAKVMLEREDTLQRTAARLAKLLGEVQKLGAPPMPGRAPEKSYSWQQPLQSSPQTEQWHVKLLNRDEKTRRFEISSRDGGTVTLHFSIRTLDELITIDNVAARHKSAGDSTVEFDIPTFPGVRCRLRMPDRRIIRTLSITFDDVTIYDERPGY